MSGIFWFKEEKMMEIHGTIHFKLILPHFPGFQQEPLPAPVCSQLAGLQGLPLSPPRFSLLGRGRHLLTDQNEQNQRIGGKRK
ncbi:MAG: hypothetical protein ACLSHO_03645 [Dysosmobacter sp.]